MMDLVIGGADGYTWENVKIWYTSLRETGYTGDVVLICYRVNDETCGTMVDHGIQVIRVGHNYLGNRIDWNIKPWSDNHVCQIRFFHIWQFLQEYGEGYDRVIHNDVADIAYQRNPSEWLDNSLIDDQIVAPYENIRYKDEAWAVGDMRNNFGPGVFQLMQDAVVINAGSFAGSKSLIRDVMLTIHSMALGRVEAADQAALNILLRTLLKDKIIDGGINSGWSAQCACSLDPTKRHYQSKLIETDIRIRDGLVYNKRDELAVLVHQWNKVPELKDSIEARYGV